jgi:uncharacterized protein (DUF2147 family)
MRRIYPTVLGLALLMSPAFAAEPTGEWEVENGYARVRIENCGDALWGAISWEKQPGGVDDKNGDPKLRGRPVLGMPILLNLKPARDRWEGEVYNSQDGNTYSASIRLMDPDTLRLEGCVLSIFCGSQNWTRVQPQAQPGTGAGRTPPPAQPGATGSRAQQPQMLPGATASRPTPPPARASQSDGRATQARAPAQPNTAAAANQDFCMSVTGLPGRAHQNGLKQDGRR